LVRLSFGTYDGDVGPGYRHVRSGVDDHEDGLSPPQPCVTRLGSAFLCWLSARGGDLNIYPGVPPFPPAPGPFLTIGHPFCPPFWCFRSQFGPSYWFQCVSRRSSFSFPAPVVVFCLHSVRAVTPVVAWFLTAPARQSSRVSSPGGGDGQVCGFFHARPAVVLCYGLERALELGPWSSPV
jgi:hypothetical protein